MLRISVKESPLPGSGALSIRLLLEGRDSELPAVMNFPRRINSACRCEGAATMCARRECVDVRLSVCARAHSRARARVRVGVWVCGCAGVRVCGWVHIYIYMLPPPPGPTSKPLLVPSRRRYDSTPNKSLVLRSLPCLRRHNTVRTKTIPQSIV